MLEWLVFPAAIALAATIPKGKMNDRKMIETIIRNVGYSVNDGKSKEKKPLYPKFKRRTKIYDGEAEIGWTYHFSIPPGLPATELAKEEAKYNYFTDSLMRPVEVEYKKGLRIHVYNEELPEKFPYDLIPVRDDDWYVPIGKAVTGIIWHNFSKTPHFTIAGTTRFGKTVMLRSFMTYLIEHHPDDCEFYIIDLKGGLEFHRYLKLRQVKMVAKDTREAYELLTYITNDWDPDYPDIPPGIAEQEYIRYLKNGWANTADAKQKKRRFIIVDEGAQLAPQKLMTRAHKDMMLACQEKLSRIAGVFGGVGFSLIFATQYPTSDTLPRLIKQNADAKISFRLPSGYASGVAIDDYGAEQLPSELKGRALFKTHVMKELQAPLITHEEMWEKLAKYQRPTILEGVPDNVVEYTEQTAAPGTNIIQFRDPPVRNKRAAPKAP